MPSFKLFTSRRHFLPQRSKLNQARQPLGKVYHRVNWYNNYGFRSFFGKKWKGNTDALQGNLAGRAFRYRRLRSNCCKKRRGGVRNAQALPRIGLSKQLLGETVPDPKLRATFRSCPAQPVRSIQQRKQKSNELITRHCTQFKKRNSKKSSRWKTENHESKGTKALPN